MLNISGLNSGYVIDHIPAGLSMSIYKYLHLSRYDNQIAIIKNAKSSKMGKKDIIKIEGVPKELNLPMLSIFGDSITVNVIVDGVIKDKLHPTLPETVKDIFTCKNPRCITSVERGLPHIFKLTDKSNITYRCIYCEQAYKMKK
ncbi:MAG: aspartate carbamoyltransferase regulatory subunit [Catonella sp.]|uniref:aspartate carbamoyltransferase regulatory subunit n=1 Tax=Catonella sp. TaxID=2382125 RepID=UPI003FA044D3